MKQCTAFLGIGAAAALLSLAAPAQASIRTSDFFPAQANYTGLWGDFFPSDQPPGIDWGLEQGDLFDGTMDLPSQTVAPDAAPSGFTFYGRYIGNANVQSAADASFRTRYSTDEGILGVGDNAGSNGRDAVTVFSQRYIPVSGARSIPVTILINLEGPADLFSGNDIPIGVTLDDFTTSGALMMWTDTQPRFIEGALTSFSIQSVIPAPGSLVIAATLLGGWRLVRRR